VESSFLRETKIKKTWQETEEVGKAQFSALKASERRPVVVVKVGWQQGETGAMEMWKC
jgi:acyl-CoA synthetase (NDP forming)